MPEAVQDLIDELVTVKKQLDIYTQREGRSRSSCWRRWYAARHATGSRRSLLGVGRRCKALKDPGDVESKRKSSI